MKPISDVIRLASDLDDDLIVRFLNSNNVSSFEQAGVLLRISAVAASTDLLRARILSILGDDLDSAIYYLRGTLWGKFIQEDFEFSADCLRNQLEKSESHSRSRLS